MRYAMYGFFLPDEAAHLGPKGTMAFSREGL